MQRIFNCSKIKTSLTPDKVLNVLTRGLHHFNDIQYVGELVKNHDM